MDLTILSEETEPDKNGIKVDSLKLPEGLKVRSPPLPAPWLFRGDHPSSVTLNNDQYCEDCWEFFLKSLGKLQPFLNVSLYVIHVENSHDPIPKVAEMTSIESCVSS